MDPAGPWPYTYNRVSVTGVSSTASNSAEFHHGQLTTTSTTLTNTTTIGSAAPGTFSPSGFVSPSTVGYDTVFSPIFHHTNPKPTNYSTVLNSPHRQTLSQAQTGTAISDKIGNSRENYASHPQQQTINSNQTGSSSSPFYVEHSGNISSTSSTTPNSNTTLAWQQQGANNSISANSSSFGILPHESIVAGSISGAVPNTGRSSNTKSSSNNYENFADSHFSTTQTQNLNHIANIRNSSNNRSVASPKMIQQQTVSPTVSLSVATVASSGTSNQFYRQPLTVTSYTDSITPASNSNYTSSKTFPVISSSSLNPTCILVTTSPTSPIGTSSHNNPNVREYRTYTSSKSSVKSNIYGNTSSRNTIEKIINRSTTSTSPVSLGSNVGSNTNNNFGIPASMSAATSKATNQTLHLVQTKAQTKIYPEVVVLEEYDRTKLGDIPQSDPQESPISYCIIDGRIAYTTAGGANIIINESPKCRTTINPQQLTRHFVVSNNSELMTESSNRAKMNTNAEHHYTGTVIQNDGTNAIIVPRRQSPSQSTQIPSPAYPVYNSPMNAIESPLQHSSTNHNPSDNTGHIVIYKTNTPSQTATSHSPLDATVSRNSSNLANSGPVVYSSVITRALVNEQAKIYNPQQPCWENSDKTKKFYTVNSGSHNEIVMPAEIHLKQTYYEPTTHNTHIGALSTIKTEEQITENILVTTDHPLISQIEMTTPKIEDQQNISVPIPIPAPVTVPQATTKTGRRRKNQHSNKTREQLLSENEFLINRVPPPAHCPKVTPTTPEQMINMQHGQQQQENGGTYFEFEKWSTNLTSTPKTISCATNALSSGLNILPGQIANFSNQTVMVTHAPTHHSPLTSASYFPTTFHIGTAPAPITSINEIPVNNNHNETNYANQYDSLNESNSGSHNNSSTNFTNTNVITSTATEDPAMLKVIVPNIEEELGFLSETKDAVKSWPSKSQSITNVNNLNQKVNLTSQVDAQANDKKFGVSSGVGSGFMASYVKFLQGERECSPPPLNRNNRKTSWQRPLVLNPITTKISSTTNSVVSAVKQNEDPKIEIKSISVQEKNDTEEKVVQQPVQTEQSSLELNEKKRKLDDEAESKRNKSKAKKIDTINQTKGLISPLPKKARPQMAMQMHSMSNNATISASLHSPSKTSITPADDITTANTTSISIGSQIKTQVNEIGVAANQVQQVQQQIKSGISSHSNDAQIGTTYQYQHANEDPLSLPPRRQTSLRKAKARGIDQIMQKKLLFDNEDQEEPQEFADSDADPVWTPHDENSNDEKKTTKRKTKKQMKTICRSRKSCSNILTAAAIDAGIGETCTDEDDNINDVQKKLALPISSTLTTTSITKKGTKQENSTGARVSQKFLNSSTVSNNFKTGDFVVIRTDLLEDWPPIWQVDGKAILKKYEPFCQNGKMYYKNMSTYAALTSDSRKLYIKAPIRIFSQTSTETVVEFMRSELLAEDTEQYIQKVVKDFSMYRDNFDIYLQTLISHSLDSNFFDEIMREQDEYFLSHIKIIDDLRENCKRRLLSITPPLRIVLGSIETWPNCDVSNDFRPNNANQMMCTACHEKEAPVRLLFSGQPYDKVTLQALQICPGANNEKDILLCRNCASRAQLFHKMTHEKYKLFLECSKKITEGHKDPTKAMTQVLKDLLADNNWVEGVFYNIRYTWAEVHSLERQTRFLQVVQ